MKSPIDIVRGRIVDIDKHGIVTIKARYEGCVLDWYEHNGYDDSDWYAICWNEEKQTIDKVLFDTTRCACSGHAEIDATPEVLRKVYHYWRAVGAYQRKRVGSSPFLSVGRGHHRRPA